MTALATLTPRHLAWLPAALLLSYALLAAMGVHLVSPTNAASTGSTTVSATVDPELTIGGTCIGASLSPATNLATTDGVRSLSSTGTCTVTNGTNNNATGTLLRVETPRATAGDNSFCTAAVTASCGATSFTDVAHTGVAALADGEFGVQVTAETCSNQVWAATNFYGLRAAATAPGTGDTVCDHTSTGTATTTLDFSVNPGASQTAGTYQARADFTVEAS